MKKYLLLSLLMTFTAGLTEAQQDLFRNSPIISRGIHKLDIMGMKYEYEETEGGHIWTNWRDYLTAFAQRVFR